MNTFFFDDVQYPEGLFGGKDFFNPIIYSTKEREVGVWTDNKPLYQKTVVLNAVTVNANSFVSFQLSSYISDLDKAIFQKTVAFIGTSSYVLPSIFASSGLKPYDWDVALNGSEIYISRGSGNGATADYYIIVQYTKTTDVAGSGAYTTLGVPAVHYDGNEKIIGTWFGETLYEKTINATVAPPYLSMDLSSLNINEVVGFEGCSKSSSGDSIPLGYSVASGSQYLVASFEKATSTLYISLGSGLSVYNNVYVTIRYTKTS